MKRRKKNFQTPLSFLGNYFKLSFLIKFLTTAVLVGPELWCFELSGVVLWSIICFLADAPVFVFPVFSDPRKHSRGSAAILWLPCPNFSIYFCSFCFLQPRWALKAKVIAFIVPLWGFPLWLWIKDVKISATFLQHLSGVASDSPSPNSCRTLATYGLSSSSPSMRMCWPGVMTVVPGTPSVLMTRELKHKWQNWSFKPHSSKKCEDLFHYNINKTDEMHCNNKKTAWVRTSLFKTVLLDSTVMGYELQVFFYLIL